MKIGDVYYEKHTVVGISERTNTVSETDVEIVNMLPIDVLDKIRAEIESEFVDYVYEEDAIYNSGLDKAIEIIDKYKKESEVQK